ncbi:hypothetical protein AgCh_021995 [Apium graveolens]
MTWTQRIASILQLGSIRFMMHVVNYIAKGGYSSRSKHDIQFRWLAWIADGAALSGEIRFIRNKPKNWRAEWCFIFKGVDGGKDMFNLEITNVRKFQNFTVKKEQRSEFILQLKMLMEDLGMVDFTIK